MLAKKDRDKFPATRLLELDNEREELLEILKEEKESKEEWAEKSGNLAKPEEIDKLFCSREEPCSPTITLDTNLYLNARALQDKAEDVAMDILFCSPENCKQVMLDVTPGSAGYKPVPQYTWEKERDEQIQLMDKPTYFQKVRKYLSELWQQRVNTRQSN